MVNCNFSGAAGKSQSVQVTANTAFDTLVTEAGRRQSTDTESQRNSSRNENRSESREARRAEQPRRRENTRDEETSSAGAAVVQDTHRVQDVNNSNETAAVNEEDVIAKVAEILEVPVEVVMEWLQELEMNAEDLIDPQAVAKLLQVALDAESPAELLTNEKFPAIYAAINEAVEEMENEINLENLNAVAEELEAVIENGKVVIANRNSSENRQSTEQNETEQPAEQISELPAEVTDAKLLAPEEITVNDAANPAVSAETTVTQTQQTVTQAAPSQQPVNTANIIEQIMNQVKLSSGGVNFNEIRMTLRPETLGDIVLRVITQNGIVMAQFEAENQRVKEALESDFNSLRNALEQQGIKFSELSVSVRQDENERMNQFEHARQRSRHRAESVKDISEEETISYHNGVIDVTA